MICYFSATGNCLHVARSIAQEGERLLSVTEAVRSGTFLWDVTDGRVGIVSPTYDWTLPSIVSTFLERLELRFQTRPYLFYVGTYGTTCGAAAAMADDILKKKGLRFDARFDIKMPDTWTPIFDLSDPERVAAINRAAEEELRELNGQLARRVTGSHMDFTTPKCTGYLGKAIYDGWTRKTAHLTVTDTCIGCGLCAKKCPVQAIELKDGRPVWTKERCVMCLGCLHRCPKFAIQYGKHTKQHGQYQNPYARV